MGKTSKRGISRDRKKVAGKQAHEVRYEKDKMNVSSEEIKKAIDKQWNRREDVERNIRERR